MSNEVIITNYKNQYITALLKQGKAVEIFIKGQDTPEIGDIFIGKVKNIVENIQAAFVEIQPGLIGYYSLISNSKHLFTSSRDGKLRAGDEILVQIERGGIKSKAPVLTSKIQLSGNFMVFLGNNEFVGVSKKITNSQKRKELKIIGQSFNRENGHGVIFRTLSMQQNKQALFEEYSRLLVDYNNFMSISKNRVCYSKIFSHENYWLKYVHAENISDLHVITDVPEIYESFTDRPKDNSVSYEFYKDTSYPLIKLKSLETQIDRALNKNVWLRSGASLVIEPTETLTAIDVNTSKTEIRKKNEDTFYQINIEAAVEICRQLRLRNLSGMILVDFINMESQIHKDELMRQLTLFAKDDPVQTNVIDMTALGLVEITRKRTYRPLHEQIDDRRCFNE